MTILYIAVTAVAAAVTVIAWLIGPRRRQRRMPLHVGMRLLALGLILGALLEPYWQTTRAQVSVVSVIDLSTSATGGAPDAALGAAAPYIRALPDDAEVATVGFGGSPTVVRGLPAPYERLPPTCRSTVPLRTWRLRCTSLSTCCPCPAIAESSSSPTVPRRRETFAT